MYLFLQLFVIYNAIGKPLSKCDVYTTVKSDEEKTMDPIKISREMYYVWVYWVVDVVWLGLLGD